MFSVIQLTGLFPKKKSPILLPLGSHPSLCAAVCSFLSGLLAHPVPWLEATEVGIIWDAQRGW